jgi:hypothetical protein
MPEMRDPFKDDPVQQETKRTQNHKTTATQRHWYKTVRPAPVYAAEEAAPETFVVGNASPIYTGR